MLVNVVPPTNDFHALARYLVNGKAGTKPKPERVAWTLAANLPTDDPELAASYMMATAELSKRTTNAAYHAMIAWHADERPTPEIMQTIALRTLDLAGLGEHQALIMGHGDKPHAHLHMLVNRVHPESGKAWSTSHDYRRFDAIMRQLSDEHGFLYVPAHRFNLEQTEHTPKEPAKRATYAATRGADTGRTQWSRADSLVLGKELTERVDRAGSWADIAHAFAERGLHLERKGQGLVAGGRTSYTKFSALRLATSAKSLERRFGTFDDIYVPSLPKPRPWYAVDGVDIVRTLVSVGIADKDDLRSAIDEAKNARYSKAAEVPLALQMRRDLIKALKASTAFALPIQSRERKLSTNRNVNNKPGRTR